jgi:hypothetical protein
VTAPPLELLNKVKRVWSGIDPAAAEDMKYMEWGWGKEAADAFRGVKPVDVDIDSSGFQVATPLLELPAHAAAAYLGTYLISLLDGLDIQEKVGFPTDISTRAHTLAVMTAPNFWTEIAGPNLPPDCLEVVSEVADLLIAKRVSLALTDAEVATLQRLTRSINRKLAK